VRPDRVRGPRPEHVRLARLLAWGYFTEVGAAVIYRLQALLLRDGDVRGALGRLAMQESEHRKSLLLFWGAPAALLCLFAAPVWLGAAALGLGTGIAGRRTALRLDRDLERKGIALYEETLRTLSMTGGGAPGARAFLEGTLVTEREHLRTIEELLYVPRRGSL
jgi:rubrerythrin